MFFFFFFLFLFFFFFWLFCTFTLFISFHPFSRFPSSPLLNPIIHFPSPCPGMLNKVRKQEGFQGMRGLFLAMFGIRWRA